MKILSGDISGMVFKGAIRGDIGEFSLDSQMLKILMQLDGEKTLADVARSLEMDMETLRQAVTGLYQRELIERVTVGGQTLTQPFFDQLKAQLAIAVGPLAEFLIEDEVQEMGLAATEIPRTRAAELVDLLARQIPRNERQVQFRQAIVSVIRDTLM